MRTPGSLRSRGLAAVAVGGFGPPLGLMVAGWRITPATATTILACVLAGLALGGWTLAAARRNGDVPAGAFGALAVLASVGWGVGFLLPALVF